MIRKSLIFLALLVMYGFSFIQQEKNFSGTLLQLSHPVPTVIQETALGYLKQIAGEMHFIKASVFYGGLEPGRDPLDYAEPFAQHLAAAADLHPPFVDTYHLCQSTLPSFNEDYTLIANKVLGRGAAALPDDFVLPFFIGFNYFYHLKDSGAAAVHLQRASQLPKAPSWLGHLASMLAAEDGDIYGGLIWLKAMLAGEEDEYMRERYENSISQFERAVIVQQAIERYKAQEGQYPSKLKDLVPSTLPSLPEFDPPFVLSWTPPQLRLQREQIAN